MGTDEKARIVYRDSVNGRFITGAQADPESEARAGLQEEVEFFYHTADAIAAERPGFNDRFRMLLTGDSKLINATRSAVQDAAPLAKTFIENAMPAKFLESLRQALDAGRRFDAIMRNTFD